VTAGAQQPLEYIAEDPVAGGGAFPLEPAPEGPAPDVGHESVLGQELAVLARWTTYPFTQGRAGVGRAA
jgi:hypothetical protein